MRTEYRSFSGWIVVDPLYTHTYWVSLRAQTIHGRVDTATVSYGTHHSLPRNWLFCP